MGDKKDSLTSIVIVFFAIFFTGNESYSYEVRRVCAEYENTGSKYNVEVSLIKGDELNQRTQTLDYDIFAEYATIFWNSQQATVIKLNDSFCTDLSFGQCEGEDQNGDLWRIESGSSICF